MKNSKAVLSVLIVVIISLSHESDNVQLLKDILKDACFGGLCPHKYIPVDAKVEVSVKKDQPRHPHHDHEKPAHWHEHKKDHHSCIRVNSWKVSETDRSTITRTICRYDWAPPGAIWVSKRCIVAFGNLDMKYKVDTDWCGNLNTLIGIMPHQRGSYRIMEKCKSKEVQRCWEYKACHKHSKRIFTSVWRVKLSCVHNCRRVKNKRCRHPYYRANNRFFKYKKETREKVCNCVYEMNSRGYHDRNCSVPGNCVERVVPRK